jgi:type I restriction enzyme, S subunit
MSPNDWLRKLPSGWVTRKLKYIVQLPGQRADTRPDGASYVGLENIESRTGRLINAQEDAGGQRPDGISTVNLFKSGDLLFGKLRPYLAKGWLCTFDGACSTEALVFRPNESVHSKYLLRVLLSQDFIREVDTTTFGSKMPRAEWDSIGNLEIPLPPIAKQRAISDYLDDESHRLDQLITKKRHLIGLLREKRSALVAKAVTQGLSASTPRKNAGISWLGEIPTHWRISRIAWLFRERDERNQPTLPLLEVSIHQGVQLRKFSDERIEQVAEDFNSYKVARKYDISFNKMRMWQGAVGSVPQDGLVSPDYVVAEPIVDLDSEYYGQLFRVPAFSAESGRRSHGMVWDRLRLYWEEFRDILVPVPPLAEQQTIVRHIQIEAKALTSLINATEKTVLLLQERRAAMISAAISGQLGLERKHENQ